MATQKNLDSVQLLTTDFHVWPDLHGNRSPLADPSIKGMICGLTMSSSIDNLALTYLGFVQALAVYSCIFLIQTLRSYPILYKIFYIGWFLIKWSNFIVNNPV